MAPPRRPLAERFWEKVDVRGPDECWPWTRAVTKEGYGRFAMPGRTRNYAAPAHCIAYELHYGRPIQLKGLHHCDNPPCCNPAHIYDGTLKKNSQDRERRGRSAHNFQIKRNEDHGRAKLTNAQVAEIRQRYAAGGVAQVDLAKEYGVHQGQISRITLGFQRKL